MLDRIGIHTPADLGAFIDHTCNDDTGMHADLYRSTDDWDERPIVAAYHDAVGLVTYYRADTLETAYSAIFD